MSISPEQRSEITELVQLLLEEKQSSDDMAESGFAMPSFDYEAKGERLNLLKARYTTLLS